MRAASLWLVALSIVAVSATPSLKIWHEFTLAPTSTQPLCVTHWSYANSAPYDIVHRLLMKDGRVKYVNEHCETFYDEAGKPLRSIGTVQDITERKQAEEELRLASVVFEQSAEAVVITDAGERRCKVGNKDRLALR